MAVVRIVSGIMLVAASLGPALAGSPRPPLAQADTTVPGKALVPGKTLAPDILPPDAPGLPLAQPIVAAGLTPAQAAEVEKVDAYFNALRVMSGHFTQINPDGTRSTGDFWIQKPGRLRFEYDRPSATSLIADGRSVAVLDRKLHTQQLYFLAQTPLRFLLADKLDLMKDTNVTSVTSGDGVVNVSLVESHAIGGSATIQLQFSAADTTLKQWTVTDPQGFDTTVALDIVNTTDTPPAKYFTINERL